METLLVLVEALRKFVAPNLRKIPGVSFRASDEG